MSKYKRYCNHCGLWFDSDDNNFKACTLCGTFIKVIQCNRCGYMWAPRRGSYPRVCANTTCKSPYYNSNRKPKFAHLLKEKK